MSRRAAYIGGMSDTLTHPAVQPSLFIPHGGGPCFFMPDPRGTWTSMEAYLRALAASLPEKPRAILVVSGHWEERAFAFTGSHEHPGLIFDYARVPAGDLSPGVAGTRRAVAGRARVGAAARRGSARGDRSDFAASTTACSSRSRWRSPKRTFRWCRCRSTPRSTRRSTWRRARRWRRCVRKACSCSARG